MAFLTDTGFANSPMTARLATLRQNFAEARAKRKVYRETLGELSALNDRDLTDLGISRSMIKSIALDSAYGA